jgi:hypothetical protein
MQISALAFDLRPFLARESEPSKILLNEKGFGGYARNRIPSFLRAFGRLE